MQLSQTLHFLAITVSLGAAACGGDSNGFGGSGGSASSASSASSGGAGGAGGQSNAPVFRGACASDVEIGYFIVQHEADYSVVNGEVDDGVVPAKILENVGSEGDCTLWRRKNPFCNPACMPGQTCDQQGKCIPYPQPKNVGTVIVKGLEKPVEMVSPSYFDTNMPHPAFLPGASIVLKAAGADYPAFTLFGEGFAPISIPKETWIAKKGMPLTMNWTPDSSAPHANIRLRLNIDQHGNSPVELICEVKDTGSTTIPASLVDKLVGFGVTGFPSGHIIRHTVDSTSVGPGCVRFEVFSHAQGDLQVADHIPCDATHPCPMPKTCDIPTGTCL